MSTFEKFCKSDHALIWLGDDKYAEVKPLQIKGSNIAEWQLLADSTDHLHEKNRKNKKQQRRTERSTASVSTPTKTVSKLPSQQKTRTSSKRDSKVAIDYKQFHEAGTWEEKRRKIEKFLPSSGPSASRLEAQHQITQAREVSRKVVTSDASRASDAYQPRRNVVISSVPQRNIKQEPSTSRCRIGKLVKPEPGIFLTRRRNPTDDNRPWKYVHVSGRQCRQGGERDCNSQSENEMDAESELPDLPFVPESRVSTDVSTKIGNIDKRHINQSHLTTSSSASCRATEHEFQAETDQSWRLTVHT